MELDPEMLTRQEEKQMHAEKIWKMIFRYLAITIAITGLILQSLVAVQARNEYYYFDGSIWFSPESFIFFGISLFWCVAELIAMRVNKRGIHSGALVAIDLILWMGFLGAGLTELLLNYWNEVSVAAGAFGITCSVLHFILFVWACVDTDRRRRDSNRKMLKQLAAAMFMERQKEEEQKVTGKGSYSVPPGMALVPIETLAQMNQPLPTYNQQSRKD